MQKGHFGGAEEQPVNHLWGHGQPIAMDSGKSFFSRIGQPSLRPRTFHGTREMPGTHTLSIYTAAWVFY